MHIDDLDFNIDESAPQIACKGLVFRGYNNKFVTSDRRIGNHQGVRLLKKLSCPGCQWCDFFFDDMGDMIYTDGIIWPEIIDGKLYSIHVVNIKRDWESGIVDDYQFEIFQLPERP